MAKYILMLRDTGTVFDELSPEALQKAFERYRSWSSKLREQGKLVGGEKLQRSGGKVVKRVGSRVAVTDGPFVEAKEILGGFFVLEANGYDEALSLANDCPHLDFGSMEIREIEITSR